MSEAAPIRVLLLCERLDVAGGVERFVCELANHLVGQGLRVAVGSVDTPAVRVRYPLVDGVEVLAGAARRGDSEGREATGLARHVAMLAAQWRTGRSLARLIRSHGADVIVLNGLVTACSTLPLCLRLAPRVICCDHNHFGARSALWQRLRAWLYPKVGAVVSLTEADAPKFAALNPRTRVIWNASSLRANEPALPPQPLALAIGRFVAQKGIDLLLAAWPTVVAAIPAARLRIVGDGPLGDALRAQAVKAGVQGSVEWVAPAADIERHHRAAAVFVLPSRYEGMPLALLEAQALGVPAVAFDCPTGPRDILAADTGVLVSPGDVPALAQALIQLLGDPPRRERMAWSALRRSQALFSPQAHFERWTALVREVAHG